jgi:ABC-type transporter Mla maintaining outer membrane lipid asymmetry ATPase subunit MlaF
LNSTGTELLIEQSPPHPSAVDESRTTYLGFEHVSLSFGTNQVLSDVSFDVLPGETVCILGRSGVGKSVCLRILMGFLKPDVGRVIAAGEDITDYSEMELERLRKKVTMVFQSGALFDSLTVWENVAFPLQERRMLCRGIPSEEQIAQTVDDLLEMVGAKHTSSLLPSDISTGMKRSVAIARALAAKPKAVLFDEPTTMVDPLMARRLGGVFQKLTLDLKLTSIVVTHDMRLVEKLAGHVVFLDRGKVIFCGTPTEMERSPERLVQQFLQLDQMHLRAALDWSEAGTDGKDDTSGPASTQPFVI